MRLLLVILLLFPSLLFAQSRNDCSDGWPCRGLLTIEASDFPSEGILAGVTDGDTWADTSGLLHPGTTGLLVQVRDPGDPDDPESPSSPDRGCTPFTNPEEIVGNIALIERGDCQFGRKALNAQKAGAVGFVIREYFTPDDELHPPLRMLGGTYGMQVSIPGLIVAYRDGLHLLNVLETNTVHATLAYRDPTGVDAEEGSIPRVSEASMAYPNPFADRTRFDLALSRAQHVTVTVHDVLGRRVAVLHDGVLAVGVSHAFTFEAGELPAGVYFARFTGETFTETRRVVLTR